MNDWQTGIGGSWKNWSINNGVFTENDGEPLDCEPLSSITFLNKSYFEIAPNPSKDYIILSTPNQMNADFVFILHNQMGQIIPFNVVQINEFQFEANLSNLNHGMYFLSIIEKGKVLQNSKIIKY